MDFLDQNLQNKIHLAMFRQNILEHIFIILKFILVATNDSVPKQVVQLFFSLFLLSFSCHIVFSFAHFLFYIFLLFYTFVNHMFCNFNIMFSSFFNILFCFVFLFFPVYYFYIIFYFIIYFLFLPIHFFCNL